MWHGRAASLGASYWFVQNFVAEVMNLRSENASCVFAIGKALRGHVSVSSNEIFGKDARTISERKTGEKSKTVELARRAVEFYEKQIAACRSAVKEWTLVGIRLFVVKDIRKLIGQMIWNQRQEAQYAVAFGIQKLE
jgi:hypothetical protein